MQVTNDRHLLESGHLMPQNNALTIVDFDLLEVEHFKGTGTVVSVNPRLVAHNLQIIPADHSSTMDFDP